jgi:hypothetical protein
LRNIENWISIASGTIIRGAILDGWSTVVIEAVLLLNVVLLRDDNLAKVLTGENQIVK